MEKEMTLKTLAESKVARASLAKESVAFLGNRGALLPGDYLKNYSQSLLNRQIDVFDDATFLLENNRIPSACVVSRAMIETYAFAKHLGDLIEKSLTDKSGSESVDQCLEIILGFTNSSRLKETEQKKLSKGIFELDKYKFTEQAKNRMLNSLATSEHVMKALRALYSEEMRHTGRQESRFEIIYDSLSEWVHPSQTSIFHNYAPETHLIPTSYGGTHLYDHASFLCSRALHFITDSLNIHLSLGDLADEMSRRDPLKFAPN